MWRFATAFACALAIGNGAGFAATQAERDGYAKCLVGRTWCVLGVTDIISHKKTKFAMLPATSVTARDSRKAKMVLQVVCDDDGTPRLFLKADRLLTLSNIEMRFRLDPSGEIGDGSIRHVSAGDLFEIQQGWSLISQLEGSTALTMALTFASDKSTASMIFETKDAGAAFHKIDCKMPQSHIPLR